MTATTFGVMLRATDGATRFETIDCGSRGRAVHMAETRCGDKWQAVAVTVRHEIRGKCCRCQALVFADERYYDGAAGLRCEDCRGANA